jgi:murein L,D-transpeptidase YcbB/YkuD
MEKGIVTPARAAVLAGLIAFWSAPAAAEVPVPRVSPLSAFAPVSLEVAAEPAPLSLPDAIARELTVDVSLSVADFYAARDFAPLWDEARADALRARLAEAAGDGLDPSRYAVPDGLAPAALDVALTEAALRFARDSYGGRIHPRDVSSIAGLVPPELNEPRFLRRLATEDVRALLDWVQPPHPEFQALRTALREALRARGDDRPPLVGSGPSLKLGVEGPRVALLRARLEVGGGTETDATVFDESLDAAVKDFQRASGLRPDGIVGPRTLALLDGDASGDPVPALLSNMERWRWMPRWLGSRTVTVNIPAYTVTVAVDGKETYEGRVVVGSTSNPTPLLASAINYVVVNPYWNVPFSIASNEMLGRIRANPAGYFARNGYEAVVNGRVVNPSSINWSEGALRKVRVRQKPGRGNALGSVKFLFDNPYAVYLHDTPSKALFGREARAFSHGCVRVDQPFVFADALLAGEDDLTGRSVERMVGGGERWLNVTHEVPVYLAYFTREVVDGRLVTHGDVYGLDARTQRALGL